MDSSQSNSAGVDSQRPMAADLIEISANGACWELSLANPPLNLVTKGLLECLHQRLAEVEAQKDIRCLIVHQGRARAFCAGSDMREFESVRQHAADRKILFEEFVTRRLAQLHCPTIAVIDGAALGGGFELALACDLRVASAKATVGLTETAIGGLGGSGTVRLARLVGPSRAAELVFTGRVLAAAQALDWGLVNEVVDDRPALARAREMAALICSKAPLPNRYAKQLIAASLYGSSTEALGLANELQEQIFQSQDLYRGAAAFFAKTAPEFKGN